ncbi:glutathione synthase [Varunaivibrio sulfuroxidans]|uniref:Glutathione synthetase n=1 Tax=Varunaivibrio sulfuroxidans TaxID=1773489 RepID=A0A4R3JJ72_9PROT|nr:glutathione synthase [Varunaivibrio sulfuroxidans]TCS64900.1 glutathione synthase [Varunaivibrio sulfuroxidans]WES29806.1 glutathione synthase [Varunaivibrio sulfuroxidans]
MGLNVAIQMDPIADINIDADSTFVLALEAQKRGHKLFVYHPDDLGLESANAGVRVLARARPLEVRRKKGDHFTLGEKTMIDLADMNVVLMRQDPPFDMAYITATFLLEHVHPKTLVVNNPAEVRNNPEKLYTSRFPGLIPPALISRDREQIKAFRGRYKDIIIKPLYGNGGAGVFHLRPDDENLGALLDMFQGVNREPVMAQAYLADVRGGDKRIILIDGEAAGAINRIPPEGDARSNMHAGGRPEPSTLTEREHFICETIGPDLRARGLVFTGIDVIGGYLTEINVTSPTGLQEINRFDDVHLEARLWDAIESRRRDQA